MDQRGLLEPLVRDAPTRGPSEQTIAEEAARGLGLVGAVDSVGTLQTLLMRSNALTLQLAGASALAQLQHPRGLDALRQLLSDGDELTKVQSALVLLDHRDFSGAASLWAAVSKGRLGEDRRIEVLGRLARSDDDQAKMRLAEAASTTTFRRVADQSRLRTGPDW